MAFYARMLEKLPVGRSCYQKNLFQLPLHEFPPHANGCKKDNISQLTGFSLCVGSWVMPDIITSTVSALLHPSHTKNDL